MARTQLNIRLPEESAEQTHRLLRQIAAHLTLEAGENCSIGDALVAAVAEMAKKLRLK